MPACSGPDLFRILECLCTWATVLHFPAVTTLPPPPTCLHLEGVLEYHHLGHLSFLCWCLPALRLPATVQIPACSFCHHWVTCSYHGGWEILPGCRAAWEAMGLPLQIPFYLPPAISTTVLPTYRRAFPGSVLHLPLPAVTVPAPACHRQRYSCLNYRCEHLPFHGACLDACRYAAITCRLLPFVLGGLRIKQVCVSACRTCTGCHLPCLPAGITSGCTTVHRSAWVTCRSGWRCHLRCTDCSACDYMGTVLLQFLPFCSFTIDSFPFTGLMPFSPWVPPPATCLLPACMPPGYNLPVHSTILFWDTTILVIPFRYLPACLPGVHHFWGGGDTCSIFSAFHSA